MKRVNRLVAFPLLVAILGLSACNDANQPKQEKASGEPSPTEQARQSLGTPIPAWSKSSVMYEVNVRQYTKEGTFKAFQTHLPRLKELGVDILWFMPIHPISKKNRIGTLGSYYAVQDYKAINPEFGTSEDFRALVDNAHAMGFKVIIDWVANHTGWDHAWTSNPEWYTTDGEGNIVHPPGTDWKDVADLNYDNAEMKAAMIDAMKYWVTEFDIDGYRADYAGGVPTAFWENARDELETIKPVYMLAEDDSHIKLLSHAFNSNYGWEFYQLMNGIAKGTRDAEQVKLYVARMVKGFPKGTYPLLFTSNHDENSWTGTEYERLGEAVKAMAALSFTVPGMPLIYSGQEAGLNKRLQFFEKDEITWNDLSMQSFYQELIRLKHDNPALWNGDEGGVFQVLEADKPILAFERKRDDNTVFVVMNLSSESVTGSIKTGSSAGAYHSYPSQTAVDLKEEHAVKLGPWEYLIYTK